MLLQTILETLGAFACGLSIAGAGLAAITLRDPFKVRGSGHHEVLQIFSVNFVAMLLAAPFSHIDTLTLVTLFCVTIGFMAICLIAKWALSHFSVAGILYLLYTPLLIISATVWYLYWFSTFGLQGWHKALYFLLPVLYVSQQLYEFLLSLATYGLLLRKTWLQPTAPTKNNLVNFQPFVSIHVPCHAEPPELVISTLKGLSKLHYSNYEVIVCDNNTAEEKLWKPIEKCCHDLSMKFGTGKFKFYHLENMKGAKAGALNFCLDVTLPKAELIAIVDADYISKPDFLLALTPFFNNPLMTFVQTSHDYYDDKRSFFHGLCYWEYMLGTKFSLAGMNEIDGAFTIGTMCVLRRTAVERAGRWNEKCLTEDSEIAIRLRANGGKGLYFRETFGKGTIPATLTDLKKQRFRWTAGPVQQLITHWRLFLPRAFGGSANFSGWTKLFEVLRGIQPLFNVILLIGILILTTGMLLEPAEEQGVMTQTIPPLAIFFAFSMSFSTLLISLTCYRLAGCRSLKARFYSMWVSQALVFVRMTATLAALFNLPLSWKRTPKFIPQSSKITALKGTLLELICGLILVTLLGFVIWRGMDTGLLDILIAGGGLIRFIFAFLIAPILALIGASRRR